ncbi:pectin lyase-like protein [Bimuria novae-zelandiae CBS 107.79]|uniref:pectinesterase n=1 Tax=Bimuria novae-zelandiae CBS 107.79 TaxID=1447943 RepID=A0A6A5V0L3_9PLEO|nr:pectin lyase-like protein [Bimuria novae-zelandiae CBS 107.79]
MVVLLSLLCALIAVQAQIYDTHATDVQLFPRNGETDVNPDTQLRLTFPSPPSIGTSGLIRVYDVSSDDLVDSLNLSIPISPSPYGNGSTKANYTDKTKYQTNIIGGMDFYFFPIIVRNNTATIYLHNNRLEYNKTYSIAIDPKVLALSDSNTTFTSFSLNTSSWTFTTKPSGPASDTTTVTVSSDGKADFTTLQGALDWAPSNPSTRTTILVHPGTYEELVFFQYKSNLLIRSTSTSTEPGVKIGYPNNSAFNPPNRPGPSRRPAFSFRGGSDIQLSGLRMQNYYRGQAEALLVDGVRVVLDRLWLNGSGDALTTYGSVYITETTLFGDGDTILGYASAYWTNSTIITTAGPVSWTRTSQGSHGNVLVDCTIRSLQGNSTFARLPDNSGGVLDNWPYAEMVLVNTRTEGIAPVGWGPVQGPPFDSRHVRFWEYGTMDLEGKPADYRERLGLSRQLEEVPQEYLDPKWVLGGWDPVVVT